MLFENPEMAPILFFAKKQPKFKLYRSCNCKKTHVREIVDLNTLRPRYPAIFLARIPSLSGYQIWPNTESDSVSRQEIWPDTEFDFVLLVSVSGQTRYPAIFSGYSAGSKCTIITFLMLAPDGLYSEFTV